MAMLRATLISVLLTSLLAACAHGGAAGGAGPLTATEVAILRAVADSIARDAPENATVCISLMGSDGAPPYSTPDLVKLVTTRESVVPGEDCPRSYDSMIAPLDPRDRRPPNYVDPFIIVLGRPQYPERGRPQVQATVFRGTGGRRYACVVTLFGEKPAARCRVVERWIS